jgi:hypothetical protein
MDEPWGLDLAGPAAGRVERLRPPGRGLCRAASHGTGDQNPDAPRRGDESLPVGTRSAVVSPACGASPPTDG